MKVTSYNKNYIGSSIRPKEAFELCRNTKYVLRLQRNVTYREKSKISLLFVRKTRVEASDFITNSLKKIRFCNLHLHLTTNMLHVTCN